jgi:hypothetical protein
LTLKEVRFVTIKVDNFIYSIFIIFQQASKTKRAGQMPVETTKERITRQAGYALDVGTGGDSRRIVFCAYPFEVDRNGTTFLPEAWLKWLPTYMTNPIVSFAHPMPFDEPSEKLPVGKSTRTWVEAGTSGTGLTPGLYAEIEFATHDFAEDVYQCYKGGFLSAVSIMAYPHAMSFDPVLPGQTGPTYTEVELLDISCVPIPSARNALAQRDAPETEALVKAYGRVQEVLNRAGKEISQKNLTKLKDMHGQMTGLCKSLKEFIDGVEPITESHAATIVRTSETITTQPSDPDNASATREADDDKVEEINTVENTQPTTQPVNWLDAWLDRQAKTGVTTN